MIDSVGAHRGMHYYSFALVSALNATGAGAMLISTPDTVDHPLRPSNVPVRGGFRGIYGDRPKWLRGLWYAFSLLRIGWWAWREKPSIAHFHFYQVPMLDYILLCWLDLLGIKSITTVHDVLPFNLAPDFVDQRGKIYHRLYARSSGLILNSQHARDCLGKLDSQLLEKSALILPGSYSSISLQELIEPEEAKIRIGLEPSAPVILVFGTIKPNKRLDWVIRAMPRVSQDYRDAKLVVTGKPRENDVSPYIELADQLGVASNVLWRLDYVTDEELIWYFSAADLVIFPYQWIYQSAALIMAMSLRKPIVATAVGSNIEFIQDDVTGILVPLDEPSAIAKAIQEILDDEQRASRMGQAAYDYVATELSWDRVAESTLMFYCQNTSG